MSWLPDLDVAFATEPLDPDDLEPAERARYEALPTFGPRRIDWLRGRRALRSVHGPHRSLSHTSGLAVAVAARQPVGVDIEVRQPSERGRRFFVRPDDTPADLLHVWTVKEATFKADPDNAGRILRDYRLDGSVSIGPDGSSYDHVTTPLTGGLLSIAVRRCN